MQKDDTDPLQRVEYWKEKFKASIEEQVELYIESDRSANPQKIREQYILNKIAVLTVANENFGKRIQQLEEQLECIEHNEKK